MNNQEAQFQWINATPENPSVLQDLAIRAKIRKQAMKKAVATRRAAGNYGKINLRQYPVFIVDEVPESDIARPDEDDEQTTSFPNAASLESRSVEALVVKSQNDLVGDRAFAQASLYPITGIIKSISSTGYESLRMKFGFDLLELSSLTTNRVGRGTFGAFDGDSTSLMHRFSSRFQPIQWSFFTYIPARYGENTCLTLAIDCLLTRVRQIMTPESTHWKPKVISSYLKALRSLQKAIDSPSQQVSPDVLCATEILALYELLDPTGQTAWMRHSAGISRLIHLRGPQNFQSDFEKSLFMAHVGPLMKECLLNNERCFLEQEPWKLVFRSIIDKRTLLTERSEIVIELLTYKCRVAGVFRDVSDWICEATGDKTPSLRDLANGLRALRGDLLQWCRKHEDYLDTPKPSVVIAGIEKRKRIYSTYLVCQITVSRLLASISFERVILEKDIQILVETMLQIESEVKSSSRNTEGWFLAQWIGIAHATKATVQDWSEMTEWEMERGLIERRKFEYWCKLFGRQL